MENNTQKMRVDSVKKYVAFYNLNIIIFVGYRVNSRRATQFRIWPTGVYLCFYIEHNFVKTSCVRLYMYAL